MSSPQSHRNTYTRYKTDYFVGIMQINSVHFSELASYGINESNIMSPKVNILAAAILLKRLTAKGGISFDKVGNYHSKTPIFKSIWSEKLAKELEKSF